MQFIMQQCGFNQLCYVLNKHFCQNNKLLYKQNPDQNLLFLTMNEEQDNSRATRIHKYTEQTQQKLSQVLTQFKKSRHINAFFVLSNFIDCPMLKQQPQFAEMQNFPDHIIVQLIQWMLIPKEVIKKKKIKTNVSSYPYQCREFFKENWCFYQHMYVAVRTGKFSIKNWFVFLQKDHFDKQTIYTALSYFADVMVPFARYQFSCSYNIMKSLENLVTQPGAENYSILKILPEQILDQLLNYCHYEPIFQFIKTVCIQNIQSAALSQQSMKIFQKLLKMPQSPQIFQKFPIQSLSVGQQLSKNFQYFDNIWNCLKQLSSQLQPNQDITIFTSRIMQSILNSRIMAYCVREIAENRHCCDQFGKIRDKVGSSIDTQNGRQSQLSQTSGQSLEIKMELGMAKNKQQSQIDQQHKVAGHVRSLNLLPSIGSFSIMGDQDQQQILQTLIKIISILLQLYLKVPKKSQSQQPPNSSKQIPSTSPASSSSPTSPTSPKKRRRNLSSIGRKQLQQLHNKYRQQIQYLFDNMEYMGKLVYNGDGGRMSNFSASSGSASTAGNGNLGNNAVSWGQDSRIVPFSTGENIRAISFMKFQYFRLMYFALLVYEMEVQGGKEKERESKEMKEEENYVEIKLDFVPLKLHIDKLFIIQIIKKYLSENRWNNICHNILQKICHILIMNFYGYIKKSIEKDKNKKFSDSFLAYLIENFAKRDFVFLNTVRFTKQGNLYSLYSISRDLAYTLNSTNQLSIFLNQFQPWKNFILKDLKGYEEQLFPSQAIKPDFQNERQDECKIKVDEAESIKKLVENISSNKKWGHKLTNSKTKILNRSTSIGLYSFQQLQGNASSTKKKSQDSSFALKSTQQLQNFIKTDKAITQEQQSPTDRKNSQQRRKSLPKTPTNKYKGKEKEEQIEQK